jgi:hypothetical protein
MIPVKININLLCADSPVDFVIICLKLSISIIFDSKGSDAAKENSLILEKILF